MPRQQKPKSAEPAAPQDARDDAAQVLRQFRLILNTVKAHFQQVEKKAGIGGAQAWALSVIQQQPGIGVSDLARAMDVRQSTASNLVKTLIERSLVETRKEALDRRAVQLYLLPGGTKALEQAPGPFAGVLPEALKTLDPASLKRLRRDLAQLILLLDADERAAQIPLADL